MEGFPKSWSDLGVVAFGISASLLLLWVVSPGDISQ